MGIFKKLGKAIKKNVSFKNLVKTVGKVASFVPVVGDAASGIITGAQDAHYAKKEQRAYDAQVAQQQAAYDAQVKGQSQPANASFVEAVTNYPSATDRSNPNFGQIMLGAAGGALSGAGQVLGGSSQAGQAGASILDSTLTTWLKANWWKVALGLTIVGGIIYFAVRRGNAPKRAGRR